MLLVQYRNNLGLSVAPNDIVFDEWEEMENHEMVQNWAMLLFQLYCDF